MEDFNSDELDEEIKNSQREETKTGKEQPNLMSRSGRRRVPVAMPA